MHLSCTSHLSTSSQWLLLQNATAQLVDATLELKRRRELRTNNLSKAGEHVPQGLYLICLLRVSSRSSRTFCVPSFDKDTDLFQ